MNRPANMTPVPGLGGGNNAYRAQYPNPGAQNPQPSPGPFGPPRGTGARNGFPFSAPALEDQQRQQRLQSNPMHQQQAMQQLQQQFAMGQHQQQSSLQQQQQQQQPQAPQAPSSQQSNAGAAHSTPSNSLAASQSVSSTSEAALDLNDFPALGSAPTSNPNSSASNNILGQPSVTTNGHASSYASQAGTAAQAAASALGSNVAVGGIGGGGGGFAPEDFPALGLLKTYQKDQKVSSVPLLQSYAIWQQQQQQQQPPSSSLANVNSQSSDLLGPPPGVGMPTGQQTHTHTTGHTPGHHHQQQQPQNQSQFSQPPLPEPSSQHLQDPTTHQQQHLRPSSGNSVAQTPAQQVLMSPADRWGLLGLLAMIRSADPDTVLLGMGSDLGMAGLDLGMQENLYSTFITPWSDSNAAQDVEPDFHVPACYNVQPPPPGPNKAVSFSDETLFFMFYSSPRDVLQEVAAQELYNRNWRFHKDIRLWLTKESGTAPSQKAATYERGMYTFFDPENWERTKKETIIMYDLLEEKVPLVGNGGVPGGAQQQPPPPPPPGMNVLGPNLAGQVPQQHAVQQQQHQQQLHQQQLADQMRHRHQDIQGMGARYPGVGTPGTGM